jgi:DnaJ-domain-containing protein 1
MWKRVRRILRAEVEGAGRTIADAVRGKRRGERYDPPPAVDEPVRARGAAGADVPPEDVRRAFAALEIPLTASADEIRRAYRRLMARYHPDHHATDPAREAVATELSRRLTEAYDRALAWRERRPTSAP